MSNNKDKSFNFAMGILAGVVGGIVAGVLLAPRSGEESRRELKKTIDDFRDKYSPEVIKAKEQALEVIKNSKDKIEETYNKFNDYLKAKQLAKAKNNETNVDEM